MGNPFKINREPIQKTRGIQSKSTGTANVLKLQTFHRWAAKHPPQTEISSPMPFARPLGYPLPKPSIRIRIPLHPCGTLMWMPRRVKRSALGEPLSACPGGSRGPLCRKELFRVGPPLTSCHNRLADCPSSNFESSSFESSNFESSNFESSNLGRPSPTKF